MQNNFARKQKKKEFVMVLLICMVCLSAVIWGAAAFSKRDTKDTKDNQEDIINLNETTNEANASSGDGESNGDGEGESVNSQVVKQEQETSQKIVDEAETTAPADNSEPKNSELANAGGQEDSGNGETAKDTQQANSQVTNLAFNQESILMWPVEGSIILEFNMDNTIYFPTLDSYRCNPAMVIQGDLGMNVVSASEGYVKEIGNDAEIGNYLVMSLGNDYELTYGQLKDICVKEGDHVDQAQKIGCVAEPSKYYLQEGTNVYLKLTKAGQPVDPLDYLE